MRESELDAALKEMRASGANIIDAIKLVHSEQGVSLGEAKGFVSQPAYSDIHAANQPLHEELLRYLDKGLLDDPPSRG